MTKEMPKKLRVTLWVQGVFGVASSAAFVASDHPVMGLIGVLMTAGLVAGVAAGNEFVRSAWIWLASANVALGVANILMAFTAPAPSVQIVAIGMAAFGMLMNGSVVWTLTRYDVKQWVFQRRMGFAFEQV